MSCDGENCGLSKEDREELARMQERLAAIESVQLVLFDRLKKVEQIVLQLDIEHTRY